MSGVLTLKEAPLRSGLLLYFATHGSESHLAAMRCQQKLAGKSSALLRDADVLVYLSSDRQHDELGWRAVLSAMPNPTVRVGFDANPGKQLGAKKAMRELLYNRWAVGYKWVLRLNPDVFVHNATALAAAMRSSSCDAVLAPCCFPKERCQQHGCTGCGVNTDLLALRPASLNSTLAFAQWWRDESAETQAAREFRFLIGRNRVCWLSNDQGTCHLDDVRAGVQHAVGEFKKPQCSRY